MKWGTGNTNLLSVTDDFVNSLESLLDTIDSEASSITVLADAMPEDCESLASELIVIRDAIRTAVIDAKAILRG